MANDDEPFLLPIKVAVVVAHDASAIQIVLERRMGDGAMPLETARIVRDAIDEAIETAEAIAALQLRGRHQ